MHGTPCMSQDPAILSPGWWSPRAAPKARLAPVAGTLPARSYAPFVVAPERPLGGGSRVSTGKPPSLPPKCSRELTLGVIKVDQSGASRQRIVDLQVGNQRLGHFHALLSLSSEYQWDFRHWQWDLEIGEGESDADFKGGSVPHSQPGRKCPGAM